MIYSYYCVDCGRKLEGGNITFNLSRMLGLVRRGKNQDATDSSGELVYSDRKFDDPLTLYASWMDLCSYAANSGITQFKNKKAVSIIITLEDVMELFAKKAEKQSVRQKILDMEIEDIWKADFVLELGAFSGQNESAAQKEAEEFGKRLKAVFKKEETNGEKADDPDMGKKSYYKEILISPEFIENDNNSKALYTLQYSANIHRERNMDSFRYAGKEIRGYCPHCHAPVLRGTGKYRHMPIGFIGGSRAGKTSLIIAMLSELLNNPASDFPKAIKLADSKVNNLERQERLYQKGWKIEKTQPQSVQDSFNASIWVSNQNGNGEYVILTLVDIAGELCLNSNEEFDVEAIRKYPLIDQCSLYLLCTCISDDGFRVDGGKGGIGNGISTIVDAIADSFSRRDEWLPPIGIVLTKADYVKTIESVDHAEDNPFQKIKHQSEYFAKGREMLTKLGRIYDMYHDQSDYNNPLRWGCKLFKEYKRKTYLSIFYCSATGRESEPYRTKGTAVEDIEQNVDSQGNEIHFKAAYVDTLLWWILQVAGCVPVKGSGEYCCYDIPIYGEAFASDGQEFKCNSLIRQEWPWKEWKSRSDTICRLFLNQSELDERLISIIRKDREKNLTLHFLRGISGVNLESKGLKEIKSYVNGE